MAYSVDHKPSRDENTVIVREYRCGCVCASEEVPTECPWHGEPTYCQTTAQRRSRDELVGWGGE